MARGRAGGRTQAATLGRDDWLDAAYEAVVDGGLENVRVLAIADRLGVTRGSFYWHFTDHAELVAALLQRWRTQEVEADQRLQADTTDDPRGDLLRVLDAALARRGADLKAMRFELALRAAGRADPTVAALLQEVDAVRLGVLRDKYLRLTGDPDRATDLAALLYVAIAGAMQALARPAVTARHADYLRRLLAEHLIARQ